MICNTIYVLPAASWLLAAGADPNHKDKYSNTPLHIAALGGLRTLVQSLLHAGANPNMLNTDQRSALHIAASHGHAEVLKYLKDAGGDFEAQDKYGVSPMNIISIPGPVSAPDVLKFLGIVQVNSQSFCFKLN